MKYFFTGITGLRNRGVEALVVSALEGIRTTDAAAEFFLLTDDLGYDSQVLGSEGIQIIGNSSEFFAPARFGTLQWLRSRVGARARKERTLRATIQAADVVIASGGDVFASEYGVAGLERQLRVLRLALQLGKRVVFLGHSIGPFKTPEEVAIFAQVANHAQLLTLRETLSYQYVKAHVLGGKPQIEHTADVAFLLEPSPAAEPLFAALGLPEGEPVVACSVSGGIVRFVGGDEERHLDSWSRCITHLVEKMKTHVLLVPHVQELWHDDCLIQTKLIRRLPRDVARRVRLAAGDLRAAEYKALISRCDMLVAERMHAAIAGLSTGVPTVVIGYSVKARGILADVMGSDADTEQLLISVEDFCNPDLGIARVQGAWNDRTRIRGVLQAARPRLIAAARKNFSALLNVLRREQSH